MILPKKSSSFLGGINETILASLGFWYIYAIAFFLILCMVLAIWPASGRLKLCLPDDKPEFSTFPWFSMMFGAGMGIGMLTFTTAEPMYHFAQPPATIQRLTLPSSAGNVCDAYIWTLTHWGFAAWAAVGKGIKWLSNLNLGLSFCVLAFFVIFGTTLLGLQALFLGVWDYLLSTPGNIFCLVRRRYASGRRTSRLAGWLEYLLLGLVDRFCTLCQPVLAHISRRRTVHNGIALDHLFAQPLTIQLH
jgi:choline-glycine betaine transporter